MKRPIFLLIAILLLSLPLAAQVDRRDGRAGNRKFRRDNFKEAEIDYRKAVLKDSTSMRARYNLANSLYRQEDFEGAGKALSAVDGDLAPADFHYNSGDVALQQKDYAKAVEEFRKALLQNPGDLDAKENYIYAKKMLENSQGGGSGGDGQDQNQNQDGNGGQDQNQNQDQDRDGQDNQDGDNGNRDRNDNSGQDGGDSQEGISRQQAQQMLKAIQAREKETQDKVNKEKAALLKSRQKEKNW